MSSTDARETVPVIMQNGQQSSQGYHSPGDWWSCPADEARSLLQAGPATRVPTGPDGDDTT